MIQSAISMEVSINDTTTNTSNDSTKQISMNNDTDDVSVHVIYVPGSIVPKSKRYLYKLIDIRINAVDLTLYNKNVESRKLWGGPEYYTDDSDAVAILVHNGSALISYQPPHYTGISAVFRVLPANPNYPACAINGYKSRSWMSQHDRCTLQFVRCSIIDTTNINTITRVNTRIKSESINTVNNNNNNTRNNIDTPVTPSNAKHTAPVIHMYEVNQPRNSLRNSKRRCLTDITVLYSQYNQPILKYALGLIGDRGLQESQWTTARLPKEVFYFETINNTLYELARDINASNNKQYRRNDSASIDPNTLFDKYKWSTINTTDNNYKSQSDSHTPVSSEYTHVIAGDIDSDEIEWSTDFISIRGIKYHVKTFTSKRITHN